MRSLFVDCSYLCRHTFLNTGIQRVVRCFMAHSEFLEKNYSIKVVPVDISDGAFNLMNIQDLYEKEPVSSGANPEPKPNIKQRVRSYLLNVYSTGREFLNALFGNQPAIRKFLFTPRSSFGLGFLVDRIILSPIRFCKTIRSRVVSAEQKDPFAIVGRQDTLLLLDSTWYSNIWPSVKRFREHGDKVVAVIYDLIPITHPEFCDAHLAVVFKEWFMDSVGQVDGYIAISKTVRDHLKEFMRDHIKCPIDDQKFDYFYLGWDFGPVSRGEQPIRGELKKHFGSRPTYIIVSTIEPRKNHAYLLDAFDKLWERNIDINLVIIGRIGWKVESFLERMLNHMEYNHRLFHWQDINDMELEYCYAHGRALLFPSFIEGFGLPIIESLKNKLPVIASETPIHKEIGGHHIGYCDISNPVNLADMIEEIEKSGFTCVPRVSEEYKWMDWFESSEMLYEKIRKMA
jgi:O-antigen biosynthesis alpha-1,2-rhamnosyltransferase